MKYALIAFISVFLAGCQKKHKQPSGMVKDHFYLKNGDSKMQVYVEGNITAKKMVITLHGGPGDGSLYLNIGEANHVAEKEFAIAYWDQRLAGSSQGNIQSTDLNAYTDDLKKLVYLLRHLYGSDLKIYLLAHSWGGLIAPKFLEEPGNQALVDGWIQVDGAHDYPLNDSLTRAGLIEFGKQEIALGNNTGKWSEIVNYCESHDSKNNRRVARKINGYANETNSLIGNVNPETPSVKDRLLYFTKEYNYPQTTFLVNGLYNNLVGPVEDNAYRERVSENLAAIHTPALLLWGKYDFVCPTGLMSHLAGKISSADVTQKVFQNSGHSPMFNEPINFWTTVTLWVNAH